MKFILILLLITAAHCHASWFHHDDYKDQWQQSQQQLEHQRKVTGDWQIIAGIFGLGAIVLFGLGTAIGSKTRKEVENHE
jgi:hypothetical protein